MLYEAQQGTKAYEYVKSILDAEFEEHKAYMKRVEEAVGFEFEKYQGYQPNRTLTRVKSSSARMLANGLRLTKKRYLR